MIKYDGIEFWEVNAQPTDPYPVQYLGYCTVCNTSNPSRSFNPTVPYLDTSPKDKKTILPLKNLTPAHSVSGLPAHYFIKHKLKFSLSHSPSLPCAAASLQSIVTAACPSIHCHSCISFNRSLSLCHHCCFQSSGEASSSSDSDADKEDPSRSSTTKLPPSFSCVKLSQAPTLME